MTGRINVVVVILLIIIQLVVMNVDDKMDDIIIYIYQQIDGGSSKRLIKYCDSYPPCVCSTSGGLVCNRLPLADVKKAFNRTVVVNESIVQLEELHLSPSVADEPSPIPRDLLESSGQLRFTTIYLSCPKDRFQLMVHPDAFTGTQNHTIRMRISLCDLSRLDFYFLHGFRRLESLKIWYSFDAHLAGWNRFPDLPALSDLGIYQCGGLNNWTSFPQLVNGLKEMDLQGNGLNDDSMGRILDWALKSSAGSLQKLLIGAYMDGNNLTKIPSQIGSFHRLDHLDLSGRYNSDKKSPKPFGIATVSSCLLSFGSTVKSLNIQSAGLSFIKPGAFQGDFSWATVNLADNNLTRLEQSVFQPMLQ